MSCVLNFGGIIYLSQFIEVFIANFSLKVTKVLIKKKQHTKNSVQLNFNVFACDLTFVHVLVRTEYAYTLKVDEKSDVYSFGVVLLELIAGRKPVGEFGDGVDIVRWVRKTTSELSQPSDAASVLAVVDYRLSGYPLAGVVHLFKIAIMCVEDESSARPTMREVVHMLTNPPPAPPTPSLLNL